MSHSKSANYCLLYNFLVVYVHKIKEMKCHFNVNKKILIEHYEKII